MCWYNFPKATNNLSFTKFHAFHLTSVHFVRWLSCSCVRILWNEITQNCGKRHLTHPSIYLSIDRGCSCHCQSIVCTLCSTINCMFYMPSSIRLYNQFTQLYAKAFHSSSHELIKIKALKFIGIQWSMWSISLRPSLLLKVDNWKNQKFDLNI